MSKIISFPYGKTYFTYDFEKENLAGVLPSKINEYIPEYDPDSLVAKALENPIGSPKLSELARGKNNVVIIASDHTRPVPSKIIIPKMLSEIRKGNPNANVTILIATGCHRETTEEELIAKFGEGIVKSEKILVHDCDDYENMVCIGTLPSGSPCYINKPAYEADLLVSEGFIEPHFFAGFSGGRKSVLPGIASRATVLANHCSEFIASSKARTGIMDENPIHADMLWAARRANLAFIVNVVINSAKSPIYAVSGAVDKAHEKGCDFLMKMCRVKAVPSDIVISTNGGYPLDQNIYQAVKGMTAAESTVKNGGVIIMLAKSNDGHGGRNFYSQLASEPDISKTLALFLSRGKLETAPDQWQTQIFIRVLMKASVIYISDAPDEMVKSLHMTPAHSLEEALTLAKSMLGKKSPSICAIPDGVSVIVEE